MTRQKEQHPRKKRRAGPEIRAQNGVNLPMRPGLLRFTAAFIFACIALYALINLLPDSCTRPVNENTAETLGLVLGFLGLDVSVARGIVSGGGLAFRIIPECTPIFTVGLFLSFVIFYPAAFRQKAVGLLLGVPALYLGNLARLAAIFAVSRHDPSLFEIFHVYLGQVFTMALVLASCGLWMKWVEMREPGQGNIINTAIFIARLAVISGCMFIAWIRVHHWYVMALDRIMVFGFSLFGYRINLAQNNAIYYETFSIVTVTSIILATRSISWKLKMKALAAGLGFLFLTHLIHRIDNALIAYFNFTAVLTADLTLLVIGQYLLPVLLLVCFRWTSWRWSSPGKSV